MSIRKKRLLIIMAIVIALYVVAFVSDVSNQVTDEATDVQLAVAPVVKKVMVMDIDDQGHMDESGILSGIDPILIMQVASNQANSSKPSFHYVDSFAMLEQVDSNKDARIDAADPIYPSLALAFFNSTGQLDKVVSLSDSGVRAIYLQKKGYVPAPLTRLTNKIFKEQRKVLMSDGSTHKIRLIHIKETLLKGE